MSRKVDFRNDRDAFCCRIGNDLADLILSVPHALTVRYAVSRVEVLLDAGAGTF